MVFAGEQCRYAGANLENCIVCKGVSFGQDNKGHWWMPWRQESMKDVDGCDKLR